MLHQLFLFRRTYMLCFLSSCSWWRRFYSGCSRSSSTWIQVYWNSSRIMGSNLDGIVWRCDSHRMHFCTNPRSWSCRSIQERISLYIRILCCFMRPISLMKIHENIHRLNSLANMTFELCFFREGVEPNNNIDNVKNIGTLHMF